MATALLAGAVLAVLAFSGLGRAAQVVASTSQAASGAEAPSPTTSSWSVEPGHSLKVMAPGFRPASPVTIGVQGGALRSQPRAVAGPTGTVNVVVHVPSAAKRGWQAIALRGTDDDGHALVEEVGVDVTS